MDPRPQDDEPVELDEEFLIDEEDEGDPGEDELLSEFGL